MTQPPSPLTMLLSRHTRRREFITLLGAATVWPVSARSQSAMPIIGHLDSGIQPAPVYLASFRMGLKQQGYVDGYTVAIEYRGTQQYDRLQVLAAELGSEWP